MVYNWGLCSGNDLVELTMKRINVIKVDPGSWTILKPLNRKVFRDVTIIFIIGFIGFAYFFTNGFKIRDTWTIIRNVSIPFTVFLALYIRKWVRYKQNVDITIDRKGDNEIVFNGRVFKLDPQRDYIKVNKYGNRVGSALFRIHLILNNEKLFIVRDLYREEYNDTIKSLADFLRLKVAVFD